MDYRSQCGPEGETETCLKGQLMVNAAAAVAAVAAAAAAAERHIRESYVIFKIQESCMCLFVFVFSYTCTAYLKNEELRHL